MNHRLGWAFASIISIGSLSSAIAADMAVKAPPPVVAVYNWTGFYIGGNVGGAFAIGDTNLSITDPTNTLGLTGGLVPIIFNPSPSSVIGGVHAGYNWQASPNLLIGIEGDFSFTSLRYQGSLAPFVSAFPPANSFSTTSLRIDDLATIRGRIGLVQNEFLLYLTGGGAWMRGRASGDVGCPNTGLFACGFNSHDPFSSNADKFGFVLGVGGEYKVTNNWIVGLEYLYYQFNSNSFSAPNLNITTGAPTGRCCALFNDDNIGIYSVRARLSYQFGAPVVAKY